MDKVGVKSDIRRMWCWNSEYYSLFHSLSCRATRKENVRQIRPSIGCL